MRSRSPTGCDSPRLCRARWLAGVLCLATLALFLCQGHAVFAQGQIYKYRRPDGTWVFTDSPDTAPRRAKKVEVKGKAAKSKPRDLAKALDEKIKPKNAIERASLGVVTVVSPIGKGSGFFIRDDGYILTNLHVIEVLRKQKKRRTHALGQVSGKIREIRTQLAEEQRRIDARKQELDSYRDRMRTESYAFRMRELQRWQASLDRRRTKFDASVEQFREDERKDSHRRRVSSLSPAFDIVLADKSRLRARRVTVNENWDLALLKLEGHRTPSLEAVARGATRVGDRVYAIGNPVSLHHSVAQGVLSGRERGHLKTDAKIYPGNSGGPLVNEQGQVLGINTFKRLTHKFEGLGFAVPIDRAFKVFAHFLR